MNIPNVIWSWSWLRFCRGVPAVYYLLTCGNYQVRLLSLLRPHASSVFDVPFSMIPSFSIHLPILCHLNPPVIFSYALIRLDTLLQFCCVEEVPSTLKRITLNVRSRFSAASSQFSLSSPPLHILLSPLTFLILPHLLPFPSFFPFLPRSFLFLQLAFPHP